MTKVTIECFSRIGAIATLAADIESEVFDRSFQEINVMLLMPR
jgi:hypothetical protein